MRRLISAARAALLGVLALLLGVLVPASTAVAAPHGSGGGQWRVAGQNLDNTRFNAAEHRISPANVGDLAPKWTLTTAGDVTATPTVFGGVVYVPDMGGRLWAVDAKTGAVVWSEKVSSYTGIEDDVSRTSPAVFGKELILGDGYLGNSVVGGAHIFAVNRLTGQRLWSTRVDSVPGSIITGSPTVHAGVVYVGIASKEEVLTLKPGYECCTFRGAVVALNAHTGRMLWKTYTVPSNNGGGDANLPGDYSGGAVWGSAPVVDVKRGLLYVGVGNNYTVPSGVCTMPGETGCTAPAAGDYFDSILALRLGNGAVAWANNTVEGDAWRGVCLTPTPPSSCGPDWDFGSAPNLFTTTNPTTGRPQQLLGIGQKSGIYWALDPANGTVVWKTIVGPSGTDGGIEWGSATDGLRIYVAESNSLKKSYTLAGTGPYAGETVTSGSWAALDAATGKILWQTPDPNGFKDPGFVSAANGVVYAGSVGGTMYALDAATGQILWQFASGGSVESGPAIAGGSVYWGSGYTFSPTSCPAGGCGPNNKLYAFALQ